MALQVYQMWMNQNYKEVVAPAVKKEWKEGLENGEIKQGMKQSPGFRSTVAKQLFEELSEDQQKEWGECATAEGKEVCSQMSAICSAGRSSVVSMVFWIQRCSDS